MHDNDLLMKKLSKISTETSENLTGTIKKFEKKIFYRGIFKKVVDSERRLYSG
jgi:hypothetical protein